MSKLNPKDNPRFYDVAHKFGLVVDNEIHLTRDERRDKTSMELYKLKVKECYK